MLQDQTATKEISSLQTCREYVIRLRCNIQRSLRNSQSLLKILCLQAPHSNHRHSQADGEMGGALLRALLQRERSSHPSTRSHRTSAHHGGVGCYTNTGRTRQGYRELNLRQLLGMMASPRPDQALQDHPLAASTRHPLPVLE